MSFFKGSVLGLLMSVFLNSETHSQTYFNTLDSVCFGYGKVIEYNDTLYLAGAVFNPSGSGSNVLAKYSINGQLLLVDTFSVDGIVTAGARLLLKNEELFMVNTKSTIPPYVSSTWDIQFSKLNNSFDQIWTQDIGGNQTDQPFDLIEKDNFIYIIATTNSFGSGNGDYYVIKADMNGNVIWEQTYGTASNELLWGALKTDDGNIILTGVKNISVYDYNLQYTKIDTSGQIIWEREYNYGINDMCGYGITLHDHNFLTYHNLDDGNGGTSIGYVKKLDGNGDLLWNKAFPHNTFSYFTNFSKPIENSDGTIIVSNTCKNTDGIIINRLIKLDPFGNTLWVKEYFTRPDKSNYIYDIKLTSDGGYVMCGFAYPIDTNIQHAWLVKTNCNGEEGLQYPITGAVCEQYDCTQFPIDANFTANTLIVDLATGGNVNFENNSSNTTSRVWDFSDGETDYTDSIMSHTFTQVGTYEVQLIVFHGMCSDTMTQIIEVINTTGIDDLLLEVGVKIYPNPSNGNFSIQFKNAVHGNLRIIDLIGREHLNFELNKQTKTYQVNDLPKGVYLLEILLSNGRKEIERIVVE